MESTERCSRAASSAREGIRRPEVPEPQEHRLDPERGVGDLGGDDPLGDDRELSAAGIVRVEHRRTGRVKLSNGYHLRTTPPGANGGSRKSAATPTNPGAGDRDCAPTPGRTSAVTPGRNPAGMVAAELRPDPEVSTQRQPLPPATVTDHDAALPVRGTGVEVTDRALLAACGISDIDDLSRRCAAARRALGQPSSRWAPQCLAVAIRMAVVNRGWPPPTSSRPCWRSPGPQDPLPGPPG